MLLLIRSSQNPPTLFFFFKGVLGVLFVCLFWAYVHPCRPHVFNPRLLHIKDGIPNANRCWADTQGCKKLIQQVWLKQCQTSSFPAQEALTLRNPRWSSQARDAWGQADFTHWQPWQSSSSSYCLLPQAAVDWQGLPWRSLCSGSYLRPQESMAPQALGGQEGL